MSMTSEVNSIIRDYEREIKTLYQQYKAGMITPKKYQEKRDELDFDCLWDIGNATKMWYKI